MGGAEPCWSKAVRLLIRYVVLVEMLPKEIIYYIFSGCD